MPNGAHPACKEFGSSPLHFFICSSSVFMYVVLKGTPRPRESFIGVLSLLLLPPASDGWGKVIFLLCVSVQTSTGGGYPHPRSGWGIPHLRSRMGEYPPISHPGRENAPCQDSGIPHPRSGQEIPPLVRTGWGYPPSWYWIKVHPPTSRLDWGTPLSPLGDRAATRQAVCLLRSLRRTFLLNKILYLISDREEQISHNGRAQ